MSPPSHYFITGSLSFRSFILASADAARSISQFSPKLICDQFLTGFMLVQRYRWAYHHLLFNIDKSIKRIYHTQHTLGQRVINQIDDVFTLLDAFIARTKLQGFV
jgi:hypothetical protein